MRVVSIWKRVRIHYRWTCGAKHALDVWFRMLLLFGGARLLMDVQKRESNEIALALYFMSSSLWLSLSALANNKQSICNSEPWWITMFAWAVHDLRSGGCESMQFQMPVIALMFDGPVCQTKFMVALTLRNQAKGNKLFSSLIQALISFVTLHRRPVLA